MKLDKREVKGKLTVSIVCIYLKSMVGKYGSRVVREYMGILGIGITILDFHHLQLWHWI